jgi:DNA adenine methylase
MPRTIMKKPKPVIRLNNGRQHLTSWIIESFPSDYRDLEYCDLCCGGGSIFLHKERSVSEILNDADSGVVAIYRAVRDDPKELIGRLKRLKYCDKNFDRAVKKSMEPYMDYVDYAINEIILRRFSRHGQKRVFEERGEKVWYAVLELIPLLSERLKGVNVLNKPFQELAKIWSEAGMFLYLEVPALPLVIDGVVKIESNEVPVEDHVKLLNSINDTKAKVLISGYYSTLYKRHLPDWKCARKKAPNQRIKDRKYDCLWMNY